MTTRGRVAEPLQFGEVRLTERIGKDTIGQYTNPSTEFENGGEEAREGWVVNSSDSGCFGEVIHGQDLSEHSLVVTIDETTKMDSRLAILKSWWRNGLCDDILEACAC